MRFDRLAVTNSPAVHGSPASPSVEALLRSRFYQEPHPMIMALFFVFVVAYYMCWGSRAGGVFATVRFEALTGGLCVLISIGLLVTRKPDLQPSLRVLVMIAALLFAMLIQMPLAADPLAAQNVMTDRVLKYAMLTFIMIVVLQSPRYLKWFIFAFLFACFYVTQESVQGLISGGLYWQNQGVMRLHGSVRIYAHPNSLAGLAMGVWPFVIFLFPVIKKFPVRLGLIALLCTSTVCVVYSASRTAYVAVFAFVLYWFAVSKRKLRFVTLGVIACAVILAVLPEQYIGRFKSITGEAEEGHSREARITILEHAWDIFLHNPLGVGVASFSAVRQARFGRHQDTHNLYFEVGTNLGIQGLVVFTALIWVILKAFGTAGRFYRRQLRQTELLLRNRSVTGRLRRQIADHANDLRFIVALTVAGAGFIYLRLTLGFFGMDLYEVYWWFASGLAMCCLNMCGSVGNKTAALAEVVRSLESHDDDYR